MSISSDIGVKPTERRIRFRSGNYNNSDIRNDDSFKFLDSRTTMKEDNLDSDNRQKEKRPSLFAFLHVELTRGYLLEHDEERFSARREKVYSFMKIPQELEKFMSYGFFQCADSFLFVYTFLPLRFGMAFWSLLSRPFCVCFGLSSRYSRGLLKPAEVCDLLKGVILIACSILMCYIDTNMLYHLVKSQSVMKLYIFYNMLEVGDRLFSAFGQDTIDALFWTATEPRDRRREHLGLIPHLLFALVYVFFHSLLVLFQATTLNVAFNSNNKSLLIIVMSNNFVELKGAVFKKFDKNNLFQVSCSDVRERLHLFVLLFIVVLQTMKEYAWKEERFWVLVPDCILVLGFEVVIDWIKHAFITRFNEIPFGVYREYTLSLAYDMAQTRQKYAFSDHSDLVARRMGFIPLPLGVVITRVILQAMKFDGVAPIILVVIAYLCLMSLRILVSIVILGKACDLITQHQNDKQNVNITTPNSTPKKEIVTSRDIATSPSKTGDWLPAKVKEEPGHTKYNLAEKAKNDNVPLQEPPTGPAAIFSNSAIDLNGVCIDEQLLLNAKQIKREAACEDYPMDENILEDPTLVSRSVPDIEKAWREIKSNVGVCSPTPSPIVDEPLPQDLSMKRRSESEPNLVNAGEESQDDC